MVLARIYDDPLTASQVSDLYSIVKNDVKSEVVAATDLSYLADATVAHGCWYYLYSNAFKSGDKLSLESVSKSNVKLDCETVYESGLLKLQVPSSLTAGKYLVCLTRGETKTPLGYADMKVSDKIQQVNKTGIVAHRGYHPGSVPENSLASLIEAQKLGVYGSEFDVYVTLDDVVVLYHNATFSGNEKAENASFKGKRVDWTEKVKDSKGKLVVATDANGNKLAETDENGEIETNKKGDPKYIYAETELTSFAPGYEWMPINPKLEEEETEVEVEADTEAELETEAN